MLHSGNSRIGQRVWKWQPEGGWILVLPDPSDAVTHLWAEGTDDDAAQALLDEWAAVVAQAGR